MFFKNVKFIAKRFKVRQGKFKLRKITIISLLALFQNVYFFFQFFLSNLMVILNWITLNWKYRNIFYSLIVKNLPFIKVRSTISFVPYPYTMLFPNCTQTRHILSMVGGTLPLALIYRVKRKDQTGPRLNLAILYLLAQQIMQLYVRRSYSLHFQTIRSFWLKMPFLYLVKLTNRLLVW